MPGPNWAEQVTAIATAVGALGLLGALVAAVFAGQQVKEARKARESQLAADFFRRWNEDALIETRRLVATFGTRDGSRARPFRTSLPRMRTRLTSCTENSTTSNSWRRSNTLAVLTSN